MNFGVPRPAQHFPTKNMSTWVPASELVAYHSGLASAFAYTVAQSFFFYLSHRWEFEPPMLFTIAMFAILLDRRLIA